jgi:hypothetical protein
MMWHGETTGTQDTGTYFIRGIYYEMWLVQFQLFWERLEEK